MTNVFVFLAVWAGLSLAVALTVGRVLSRLSKHYPAPPQPPKLRAVK